MTTCTTYTSLSQSDIAIQIERLVQAIEQHDSPAFRFRQTRTGYEQVEETRLSRYFTHIRQMMGLFDDRVEYRYSEHLQAFRQAIQDIGLEHRPTGPVCLNEDGTTYLDHHRSMNVLVARTRQLTRELWYRRQKGDRRRQARHQEGRICDYSDTVVNRYSRTTIVRVDLYYRQEAQVRLRVENVFNDLDRLIRERERNPIFDLETVTSVVLNRVKIGDTTSMRLFSSTVMKCAETSIKPSRLASCGSVLRGAKAISIAAITTKKKNTGIGAALASSCAVIGIFVPMSTMRCAT